MNKKPRNGWATIILDLMREQDATQRGLAIRAGVSRSALRKMMKAETNFVNVTLLEKILNELGYDLDIVPTGGK